MLILIVTDNTQALVRTITINELCDGGAHYIRTIIEMYLLTLLLIGLLLFFLSSLYAQLIHDLSGDPSTCRLDCLWPLSNEFIGRARDAENVINGFHRTRSGWQRIRWSRGC